MNANVWKGEDKILDVIMDINYFCIVKKTVEI